MSASQARGTQSQGGGTQQQVKAGRLDETDKKAKVADLVFFILSREKGRPLHKKADLMKAVDLTGRNKQDQDEVLHQAKCHLKDVFGLNLQHLDVVEDKFKNQFLLINTLTAGLDVTVDDVLGADGNDGGGDDLGEDEEAVREKARTSLLFSLLALIYMSPGQVVREDVLDSFLAQMGIKAADGRGGGLDTTTAEGNAGGVDEDVRKVFGGDVKALIRDEFSKKQHYFDITEVETGGEGDHKILEYRWGVRANVEVRKSEILKMVAKMYDCDLKDFKEQYEDVKATEGDPEEEDDEDGDDDVEAMDED